MHAIYDKLQKDCVTGPFMLKDGQQVPRPYAEYPKWVRKSSGEKVIVRDIREEAAIAGQLTTPLAADPLATEREALNAAKDQLDKDRAELEALKSSMRAQLDELAIAREALQGGQGATKAPVVSAPAGSTYRLPKDTQVSMTTPTAPKPEPEKV